MRYSVAVFIAFSLLHLHFHLNAQVWTQDFETNGLGTAYTSASVFTNNTNAHYNRTNGSNISNSYGAYYGQHGSFYWAGENQNDNSIGGDGLTNKSITFSNINVAGQTGLTFRGLFATGNQGAGYDYSDAFYVEYRMDAQPWVKCLQFATPTMSANTGLANDANLDGIGEGTALTNAFKQFTASIPVTGNTLQIRITTINNSIGEEIAFDYLRVYSANTTTVGCTNPAASNFSQAAVTDNGSCTISGCTDVAALNYSPEANTSNNGCIYTVPNLVINEIHYNPSTYAGFTDNLYEFIEIYNASGSAVSLAGWHMGRAIDYTFPQGASIPASGYILLSPVAGTYAATGAPVFVYTGTLNNTGDILELRNAEGVLVDRALYYPVTPWPVGADGNGPSLQLTNPALDNESVWSWCAQGANNGSPGAQNTCFSPIAGCTNSLASNFNPQAQQDDGSCEILGCTYASATNYAPDATRDDLTCIFEIVNNNTCFGDLNGDLIVSVDDLSLFIAVFGVTCN